MSETHSPWDTFHFFLILFIYFFFLQSLICMLPWAGTRVMLDQIRPAGLAWNKNIEHTVLLHGGIGYYFARYSKNWCMWHWMIWKLLLTRN